MKIIEVGSRRLQIPFRHRFSHASAARSRGDSILVGVVTETGLRGYGEGCPRAYVTGEDSASAAAFIARAAPALGAVRDLGSLRAWLEHNRQRIDRNPAACCALELAIIDALARSAGVDAGDLIGNRREHGEVCKYSAVIGAGSPQQLERYLEAFNAMQFDDFKIKLNGDPELDVERLRRFAHSNPGARLRVDANNLWPDADTAARYLERLPAIFFAVEEPLRARDFGGLERLAALIPQRIIVDESCCNASDFEFVRQHRDRFIANVRVSKMGGLLRSQQLVERAEAEAVPFIIGAQVGETSLLTRAAMLLAASGSTSLLAREGAAGEHLLQRDICQPALGFGPGGICRYRRGRPGLGCDIDAAELARYPQTDTNTG